MEHNFFGLPEKRIDTESMYCTQAFDTFDHIVLSYIASDLQFTDKYNRTFDKMVEQRRARRVRRVSPLIVAGAVTVPTIAITGGYTFYVDSKSRARDAEIQEEIEHERRRISSLETVVELVKDDLDAAVKKIKINGSDCHIGRA